MVTEQLSRETEYTVDMVYRSQFELSQSPLQMRWAAICNGAAPKSLAEPFSYCDLGCGDGSTLNMLAGCFPHASFIGVDINPDHLNLARGFAARAGLDNVTYRQASFAELNRLDFTGFDYIAIFGIYSWLNAAMRESVHDFVAEQLKPDGLFAVHYSSLPGSARSDLVANCLKLLCAPHAGDSAQRFIAGLRDLQRLSPHIKAIERDAETRDWLSKMAQMPSSRVIHDLLNREVRSFYFEEIHSAMATLGLRYVGSPQLDDNHPELQMSAPAHEAYANLTQGRDPVTRQSLRDILLDSSIRIDLYSRNESAAASADGGSMLRAAADFYLQRAGSVGDLEARREIARKFAADLTSPVHATVLELCTRDILRVPELLAHPELQQFDSATVELALQQLVARGFVSQLVTPPSGTKHAGDRKYRFASRLNRTIFDEQLTSPSQMFLASTVLGGPLELPEGIRIRLQAFLGGSLDQAWGVLRERSLRSGTATRVASLEQFQARVVASLPAFIAHDLPHLLELGIIEEDL